MNIFERRESSVRSYCRSFPTVFEKAKGPFLYDSNGRRYIDFFCGAGTMLYGHNEESMKQALLDYVREDGIVHTLDMYTVAKKHFLEKFESTILQPRSLDYKIQFVAPSGANAIEAAMKLARRTTRRSNIVAFTNSYHGLSYGALSITSGSFYRHESYVNRNDVSFLPFDGYLGENFNTLELLVKYLEDGASGLDHPAAIFLETIQAEGGVRVASTSWLHELEQICRKYDILMIVDDVQVGAGRTGSYFSFEQVGIRPDMVALSKAVSGYGIPMSLLLVKPELDQWNPGEHTGTFRGNNLAFVTATEALRYWESPEFIADVQRKSEWLNRRLCVIRDAYPELRMQVRGRGMIYGLEIPDPEFCQQVAREAFRREVIIERCGAKDHVLKFLPPLTMPPEVLEEGVNGIEASIQAVWEQVKNTSQPVLTETVNPLE